MTEWDTFKETILANPETRAAYDARKAEASLRVLTDRVLQLDADTSGNPALLDYLERDEMLAAAPVLAKHLQEAMTLLADEMCVTEGRDAELSQLEWEARVRVLLDGWGA